MALIKLCVFNNPHFIAKRLRVNQAIKSPTIRLIGDKGEQMGIMGLEKALKLAEEQNLDLAEVSPNTNPPVCKLMDYGKYQYHQKKVDAKHKKMQKKSEMKGVRIGFKTGEHDIMVRVKQAKKFLEGGNSVKVTLLFKGREAMYKDLAKTKMQKFYEELEDICTLEAPAKASGNTLFMILTPNK